MLRPACWIWCTAIALRRPTASSVSRASRCATRVRPSIRHARARALTRRAPHRRGAEATARARQRRDARRLRALHVLGQRPTAAADGRAGARSQARRALLDRAPVAHAPGLAGRLAHAAPRYGEGSEYFSYWHDLKCPDGTLMEQAADYVRQALLPFFPALSSATKLEWLGPRQRRSCIEHNAPLTQVGPQTRPQLWSPAALGQRQRGWRGVLFCCLPLTVLCCAVHRATLWC